MRDTCWVAEYAGVPDDATTSLASTVQRDLIVIGASAGGVEALQALARKLPADLAASVLMVLHFMPSAPSFLHAILTRAGNLPATQAHDGEPLQRGHIYVARPGYHLQVRDSSILLSSELPESGHRPAIDSLFLSAARARGSRTIGVVLTGTLDDGAEGLRLIKDHGGATVVQDPADAMFSDMPRSAIDHVEPDRIVPLDDLSETLTELLVASPRLEGGAAPESNLWHEMRALEERAGLLRRIADLAERRGSVGAETRLQARAARAAAQADEIRGTIDRLRGAEGGMADMEKA
jgi:two-component system chemotaxis response regulator CheB